MARERNKAIPTAWPPRNVNLEGSLATTVPVVTVLLAQLSTAAFLIPLGYAEASQLSKFGRIPWSPPKLAVTLGVAATACFILATLSAIHAQAQTFDLLPRDRQEEWFSKWAMTGDADSRKRDWIRDQYRKRSEPWYEAAQTSWLVGIGLFALTVGVLAHSLVAPLFSITAVLGALAGIATMQTSGGWSSKLIGLLLSIGSLGLGILGLL